MSWGFTSGAWSTDSPYCKQTSSLPVSEPKTQPEHAKPEQTGDEDSDDDLIHTPLRGASPGRGLAVHVDPSGVLPAAAGAIAGSVAQVLGQHAVVELQEEVAGLRSQLAHAMTGI